MVEFDVSGNPDADELARYKTAIADKIAAALGVDPDVVLDSVELTIDGSTVTAKVTLTDPNPNPNRNRNPNPNPSP